MYINHERRVVLFHVPKCAGEAISTALTGHPDNPPCSPDSPHAVLAPDGKYYIDGKRFDKRLGFDDKHISVARFLHLHPDCANYTKIAVVRNVFDRVISTWRYADAVFNREEPGEMEDDELHITNFHRRIVEDFALAGERYIVQTSYERMLFVNNQLAIDDILFFEQLADDFNRIVEKYDLEIFQPLGMANSTKRLAWQDYYDDELTALIQEKLAFDIAFYEQVKNEL